MDYSFDDIILSLLKRGIQITLSYNDGIIYYDLDTKMKADCKIYQLDGKFFADTRYEKRLEFEDEDGIIWIVAHCRHGRDYMNPVWAEIFVEKGILKKEVITTVVYKEL